MKNHFLQPGKTLCAALLLLALALTPLHAGPGYALSFTTNNPSQYVEAYGIPSLASNYTFCVWLKFDSLHNIGVMTGTGCGDSIELQIHGNTYYPAENPAYHTTDPQVLEWGRCNNFSAPTSTNTVPTNEWLHAAVTVSSNKIVTYYINGRPSGSWDGSGYNLSFGPTLHLGDNAVRHFQGMLDEVQIWSRALSPSEIQAGMNRNPDTNDTALVAWWPFSEGPGNTSLTDYAGHGHGATLINSPAWKISGVPFIPDVNTGAVSGIFRTSATLNGSVNPGNLNTAVWYQWGLDTSYGNLTAITNLVATNTPLSTPAVITVSPGTTYHYRLVASNSVGVASGNDQTFSGLPPTPPTATNAPATGITRVTAILTATVNPHDLPTTAWFEWGTDTNYGNISTLTQLAATNVSLPHTTTLSNLTPATTYHFRIVATNVDGFAYSTNLSFTTRNGTNIVNTLTDSGAGSLRQVIADTMDGETIVFATNGTLTLTSGELVITNSLKLVGPGITNLIISGNASSRVFLIAKTNIAVSIANVTVQNGRAPASGLYPLQGGGIYNLGNLSLTQCALVSNQIANASLGGNGGAIFNQGTLSLVGCTVNNNFAGNSTGPDGSGSGNPGGAGGAIYNNVNGTLIITGTTFSSNVAGNGGNGNSGTTSASTGGRGGNGGGIYNLGTVTLTACTLTGNRTGQGGGGGGVNALYYAPSGSSGRGGGIYNGEYWTNVITVTLDNCLIADNTPDTNGNFIQAEADLSGKFISMGHNLVGIIARNSGLTNGMNGDLLGTEASPLNPRLGVLTNNGGPTLTLALLPGSPAIDAGNDSLTGTDQRGMPRKSGQHVDIGAFELDLSGYSAPAITPATCTVSNLASGLTCASFTFSVNPNGLNTTAWIDYGISASYGGTSPALSLGYGTNSINSNLTVTALAPGATFHYRVSAASPAGTTIGPDQTFTTTPTGDLNGDGIVSAAEINAVVQNYWTTTGNRVTDLTAGQQPGQFAFGMTNATGLNFTVLVSTNLTDWTELPNAAPEFLFHDPAATNSPQRYYRLRWP